jgi:4-oxalocrotonate tautomerase
MPLVQVTIIEGRSPEKVKEMARRVTDAVAETLEAPKAAVRVVVQEVPASQWFVAGVPKSESG